MADKLKQIFKEVTSTGWCL